MEQLNRYPRGYLIRLGQGVLNTDSSEPKINDVKKDVIIEDLYRLYASNGVNRESWDFRKLVIQRCAQLYGDFHRWLILNLAGNDNIYDFNLAFLEDTIGFLRTGRRISSISTWYEILSEFPDPQHGTAGIERVRALGLQDGKEFANYIGLWCSHPGGFDDMLCTTRVLFGASKSPTKTQPLF